MLVFGFSFGVGDGDWVEVRFRIWGLGLLLGLRSLHLFASLESARTFWFSVFMFSHC